MRLSFTKEQAQILKAALDIVQTRERDADSVTRDKLAAIRSKFILAEVRYSDSPLAIKLVQRHGQSAV